MLGVFSEGTGKGACHTQKFRVLEVTVRFLQRESSLLPASPRVKLC
jgi:hypothetical protein